MQQIYIENYFKGFRRLYDHTKAVNHPQIGIAEKRTKIIEFFDKYGKEATKEAFGVQAQQFTYGRRKCNFSKVQYVMDAYRL